MPNRSRSRSSARSGTRRIALVSAHCEPCDAEWQMPVRGRRQVCISHRQGDRAWLLHASSGHAGVAAAQRRKHQRRELTRAGACETPA
jgi:hypothetical protein